MERQLFNGFVRGTIHEITTRCPDYFSFYPIELPFIAATSEAVRSRLPRTCSSRADVETALVRGAQALDDMGIPIVLSPDAQTDPISMLLALSIVDAFLAANGEICLTPLANESDQFKTVFSQNYSIESTPTGVCYALSRSGDRPLLIVSATGVPLIIWSNFLIDSKENCFTVQSRAGSFLNGGTPNSSSIADDSRDILDVVRERNLNSIDIVAWCNGSRVAIDLAGNAPGMVRSLTLIAPTFHGSVDSVTYPSPFEDGLRTAFEVLKSEPSAARHLMESLSRTGDMNSARNLPRDPTTRGDAVLSSAPQSLARELVLPLSSLDHLQNYINRAITDAAYDMRAAIAKVSCPILLITGTHDSAVNTRAAHDVLMHGQNKVLHATVQGAGHHLHFLQYNYLRYVLDSFFEQTVPANTARLTIESSWQNVSAA